MLYFIILHLSNSYSRYNSVNYTPSYTYILITGAEYRCKSWVWYVIIVIYWTCQKFEVELSKIICLYNTCSLGRVCYCVFLLLSSKDGKLTSTICHVALASFLEIMGTSGYVQPSMKKQNRQEAMNRTWRYLIIFYWIKEVLSLKTDLIKMPFIS